MDKMKNQSNISFNQNTSLANELIDSMEKHLSGEIEERNIYAQNKVALIQKINEGIDLLEDYGNKKAATILKNVLLKVQSV